MNGITNLESLGYVFDLRGDSICYVHHGPRPDPEVVRPLLSALKFEQNREEAVRFLRLRSSIPVCQRSLEEEESWWAQVFAERGIRDPMTVPYGKREE